MKINENDFKTLPQGKKLMAVLEKMAQTKPGDSSMPFFQEMMAMISSTTGGETVSVILPYLVQLAVDTKDFSYVNMVLHLKLGFYHRGNIDKMPLMKLRQYLSSIHAMRNSLPIFQVESLKKEPEEFKTLYLWNASLVYSFSAEASVLSTLGRFDGPFKVECPHCRNDIHSLYIDAENLENIKNITPAPVPETWDGLFCDDLYPVMMTAGSFMEEKYFTKILPYVYGNYRCTVCEKESKVIDAVRKYQSQEMPWFQASEDFLKRLEFLLTQTNLPAEKWMLSQFIVSQYRNVHGVHSPEALVSLLRGMQTYLLESTPEMQDKLMSYCEKEFAFVSEEFGEWYKIYQYMGNNLEKLGQIEKAEGFLSKAVEMAEEKFGKDHKETLSATESWVIFQSKHKSEVPEEPLLAYRLRLLENPEENKLRLQMFRFVLIRCYKEQEKFAQAIELMEDLLSQSKTDDVRGDCLYMLAELQENAKEIDTARENYEKALNLLEKSLTEDNSKAPVPSGLQSPRRKYACLCLFRLAFYQVEEGNHRKALKYLEKSMGLAQKSVVFKRTEQKEMLELSVTCYRQLGKEKQAKAMEAELEKLAIQNQ